MSTNGSERRPPAELVRRTGGGIVGTGAGLVLYGGILTRPTW